MRHPRCLRPPVRRWVVVWVPVAMPPQLPQFFQANLACVQVQKDAINMLIMSIEADTLHFIVIARLYCITIVFGGLS
jgi:hypothetical protein